MIDLTRLMFDDGAARPPVKARTGPLLTWGSSVFEMTLITEANVLDYTGGKSKQVQYRWFYRSGARPNDEHDIDQFLADPVAWFRRVDGYTPEHQSAPGHPGTLRGDVRFDPQLCCVIFDKV